MQELVVESLVVSLTLIMLDVLVNDEAQMPLAERDDTMEALLFDRPDEPLGIGVEIRALRRQPDRPHIATCQGRIRLLDRQLRYGAVAYPLVQEARRWPPPSLTRIIHEEADYSRKTNAPVWYKGCAHRPFATTEALA